MRMKTTITFELETNIREQLEGAAGGHLLPI